MPKGTRSPNACTLGRTTDLRFRRRLAQFFTSQKASLDTMAKDVVVIVLEQELAVDPVPLAENVVPRAGLQLVHAAYAADRRFGLSVHFNCHLLTFDAGSLWSNDCDTHPASSGGPLLTRMDGALKLAAIMLGTVKGKFNVALPIAQWQQLSGDRTCP